MNKYVLADGRELTEGAPFTLGVGADAVNFPANWLTLAGAEGLAAHGIALVEAPDPPAPGPTVSAGVSMLQARLALYARTNDAGATLLSLVETAVAAAGGTVQIYWSTAENIERAHPIIAQLGAVIGLTPSDIDELFIEAATL